MQLLPKEYVLFEFLMRNPKQVFTPEMLLDKLWSADSDATPVAVRTLITRVRQKIDFAEEPSFIENVRGLGYRFRGDESKD